MPTKREFYPNGQLRWEGTLVDGFPEGLNRRWYPNGVLSDEIVFKNGERDQFAKHWNDKGELIGTYEIRNGTGVSKSWHNNGILSGEISFVDREMTGRQRVWFEDGELVTSVFWIRGRKVSRKKYLEACQADPSLPRYDNEPKVLSWETKMKRLQNKKSIDSAPKRNSERFDRMLNDFLHDPTRQDARAWLDEQVEKVRTLGEIPSQQESLALVDEAYKEKIEELFVIKVNRDDGDFENTGTLLAKLPTDGKTRKRAIAWCNLQNEFQGFDPEDDHGQEWMIVQLD